MDPDPLHEPSAREARALPEGLIGRLRADPVRAPEHLALEAQKWHGPGAAEWIEEKRRFYKGGNVELAKLVKKRHASYARFEGAATGVGGIVTMLPDLVALAWIQSRMVFHMAAAYGYDPLDPMRPAELLVLQELYGSAAGARAALDGVGDTVAETFVDRKLKGGDDPLVLSLAKFVGRRGARRFAGRLIPGVAIAFNAIGNERETRALADRAIRFYGG